MHAIKKNKFKYYYNDKEVVFDLSNRKEIYKLEMYNMRENVSPLLQFTGFVLDGVEIYEGDYIYIEDENLFDLVIYCKRRNEWRMQNNYETFDEDFEGNWDRKIGNKYDKKCKCNPDGNTWHLEFIN